MAFAATPVSWRSVKSVISQEQCLQLAEISVHFEILKSSLVLVLSVWSFLMARLYFSLKAEILIMIPEYILLRK